MPAFAALFAAWILNAFWPLIGQDGLRHFSTPLFFHAAMLVGLAALSPWLIGSGRWRLLASPRIAWPLAAMGALSCTASLIYLEALRYTTPANAAVMAQVEVLYSAIISAWLLREKIGARQIAASFLVMAGTGLIMAHDLGSLRWKGDLMILLTPWMYQVSHVMAKRLPKDLDPAFVAGARIFVALFVLIPFSLWSLGHGPLWSWSREAVVVLLMQGLFMNALALVLWYAAILRMDLAKATAFLLSYPSLTMLISWGLGREEIHVLQVAGLSVTLLGAYWLSRITLAAGKPPAGEAPSWDDIRPPLPESPA